VTEIDCSALDCLGHLATRQFRGAKVMLSSRRGLFAIHEFMFRAAAEVVLGAFCVVCAWLMIIILQS
jgi:hypothetical protein